MIHLFLAHFVADHGFTDNTKIRSYRGMKLLEHILWSIFAFLAFTFDTLLKSSTGRTVLFVAIAIHVAGDILRTKLGSSWKVHLLEVVLLGIMFVLNTFVSKTFVTSYISREFALYLLGMAVVTMAVTYIFRNFYPGDPNYNDLDGISERLAFFIFFLGKSYLLAGLSLLLGYLYRLWKVKKFSASWWISPLSALVITLIWKFLIW
ncbi:hypothetical protein [Fervidobacterium thailandense]|uniref:DUF3307 domain-containing protein n=1 Tax=Fervidobacterium thailandense TaxID=1008305 RepID=A0A1E3G5C0_9BACT|nr:hypothetical protein [Fervidobacterium thailandense]ODN31340.1 hypothetical protein A4H02_00830 [Fervidobacterium thailandense]